VCAVGLGAPTLPVQELISRPSSTGKGTSRGAGPRRCERDDGDRHARREVEEGRSRRNDCEEKASDRARGEVPDTTGPSRALRTPSRGCGPGETRDSGVLSGLGERNPEYRHAETHGEDADLRARKGCAVDRAVSIVVPRRLTASKWRSKRGSGSITRGYRWWWREVLDAGACTRLAFLESATFGNESPAPNEPPPRAANRTPATGTPKVGNP
jgi:hypothetical protein